MDKSSPAIDNLLRQFDKMRAQKLVREMKEKGYSNVEIAKKAGVSESTIRRLLK